MKRSQVTILAAISTAMLLAGCSSSSSTKTNDGISTRTYGSHAPPVMPEASSSRPAPTSPPPLATRTSSTDRLPEPASSAPLNRTVLRDPETSPARPGGSSVGLFGELDHGKPGASGPFDGSTNLTQITFASEGADFDPDVDRAGRFVVWASTMHRPTADLYLKSVDGKTVTQLTADPADDVMPAFSPDGKKIAFASNRSGNWDIFVMPIDGGQVTQITSDADAELHPSWSPDGRMIAFCRFGSQSERWEIWVVDSMNPSLRQFLDYGLFPQWSPDSKQSKILFQRSRQRGSRLHSIWTIDYVNGQALYPTEIIAAANAAAINPAWSPDGQRISFVTVVEPEAMGAESATARPGQSDVWVVNVDGTGKTNVTNGQFANFQPTWGADGRIYFVSDRSGMDHIWAVAVDRSTNPLRPGSSGSYAGVEGRGEPASNRP